MDLSLCEGFSRLDGSSRVASDEIEDDGVRVSPPRDDGSQQCRADGLDDFDKAFPALGLAASGSGLKEADAFFAGCEDLQIVNEIFEEESRSEVGEFPTQLDNDNSTIPGYGEDKISSPEWLAAASARQIEELKQQNQKLLREVANFKGKDTASVQFERNERNDFRGGRAPGGVRGRGRFGYRGRGREGFDGRSQPNVMSAPRAWNEVNNGLCEAGAIPSILKSSESGEKHYRDVNVETPKASVKWVDLVRKENSLSSGAKMNFRYVKPTRIDGRIRVSPPKAVADLGANDWEFSLVGYFIDKRLPYPVVNSIAHKLWDDMGLMEVLVNEGGFFFFKFDCDANRRIVLEKGPWHFAGRILILKKWFVGMRLSKDALNKLPVWIQLHNVPVEYWTEEGLSYVASAVGRPLCADSLTESKKRISFARVCVEIEAKNQLVDEFDLEIDSGHVQEEGSKEIVVVKVEYQWRPLLCSKCCVFGHSDERCHWHSDPKPEEIRKMNEWIQKNDKGKAVFDEEVVVQEPIPEIPGPALVESTRAPVVPAVSDPGQSVHAFVDCALKTIIICSLVALFLSGCGVLSWLNVGSHGLQLLGQNLSNGLLSNGRERSFRNWCVEFV